MFIEVTLNANGQSRLFNLEHIISVGGNDKGAYITTTEQTFDNDEPIAGRAHQGYHLKEGYDQVGRMIATAAYIARAKDFAPVEPAEPAVEAPNAT